MKNTFIILVFLATTLSAWSQNHTFLESAFLECHYLESMMNDTLSHRVIQDTMTLLIGKNHALYFSKKLVFRDSLYSLQGGKQQWIQLMNRYLREGRRAELSYNNTEYLYTDLSRRELLVRTTVTGSEYVQYTEERESIPWIYSDSVKTILGYECRLAEANFRGRHYLAWYTLEIPLSLGPWKLWGLPGLILEASDNQGHYSWSLTSISPNPDQEVWLYSWTDNYQQVRRVQYLRAKKGYREMSYDKAQTTAAAQFVKKMKYDFKELDY